MISLFLPVLERASLIMMENSDFEGEERIITDYGFRIKIDPYGNYSKSSHNTVYSGDGMC